MYPAFRKYISQFTELKPGEWGHIASNLTRKKFAARSHLLEVGEVCRGLYFLESGILRYYEWQDGDENTLYFTQPNQLFTASESFNNQMGSKVAIQAMLPAQVLVIEYAAVQKLYQSSPSWANFTRQVVLAVNADLQGMLTDSMLMKPGERYTNLMKREPELARHIPLKYLASYLGIAPESLSRIRKRIASTGKT